jgi:hypothetical protein
MITYRTAIVAVLLAAGCDSMQRPPTDAGSGVMPANVDEEVREQDEQALGPEEIGPIDAGGFDDI